MTLKICDRNLNKESLIGHFSDALDVAKEMRKRFPKFGLLADLSAFPLLRYLTHLHLGNRYSADRRNPIDGDLQPRFDAMRPGLWPEVLEPWWTEAPARTGRIKSAPRTLLFN